MSAQFKLSIRWIRERLDQAPSWADKSYPSEVLQEWEDCIELASIATREELYAGYENLKEFIKFTEPNQPTAADLNITA